MRAAIFCDEQAGHLISRDHDRPRLGQRLHARGDIGRIAKDFSGLIHDHRPALDPDAGDELRLARTGVLAFEFGERAVNGERGANRAFGIVLLRDRVSEQSHQPVAERLGDTSAHLRHRGRGRVEVGAEQNAPVLDVETGRKAGRSDKIAEHHGDGAALGRNLGGFEPQGEARRGAQLHRKRRASQLPDCDEQPAPITDRRDADPPEIFRRYMTENMLVDPVLAKSRLVLLETETPKPPAELHGRAPHGFQG
jgi:hypothetical protein